MGTYCFALFEPFCYLCYMIPCYLESTKSACRDMSMESCVRLTYFDFSLLYVNARSDPSRQHHRLTLDITLTLATLVVHDMKWLVAILNTRLPTQYYAFDASLFMLQHNPPINACSLVRYLLSTTPHLRITNVIHGPRPRVACFSLLRIRNWDGPFHVQTLSNITLHLAIPTSTNTLFALPF